MRPCGAGVAACSSCLGAEQAGRRHRGGPARRLEELRGDSRYSFLSVISELGMSAGFLISMIPSLYGYNASLLVHWMPGRASGFRRTPAGPLTCATLAHVTSSTTDYPRLMSLAVHEFRTPASVVGGYLRMLQRDGDDR